MKLEHLFKYESVCLKQRIYVHGCLGKLSGRIGKKIGNSGSLRKEKLEAGGQEWKGDFIVNFFVSFELCTTYIYFLLKISKVLNIWILEPYYTSTKNLVEF